MSDDRIAHPRIRREPRVPPAYAAEVTLNRILRIAHPTYAVLTHDEAVACVQALADRLRRVERILAVERGDVTQVPHWSVGRSGEWVARHAPNDWRRVSHCRSVGGSSVFGWAWAVLYAGHYVEGEASTALEAIEAADAAYSKMVTR